jgi:hypothetical protein
MGPARTPATAHSATRTNMHRTPCARTQEALPGAPAHQRAHTEQPEVSLLPLRGGAPDAYGGAPPARSSACPKSTASCCCCCCCEVSLPPRPTPMGSPPSMRRNPPAPSTLAAPATLPWLPWALPPSPPPLPGRRWCRGGWKLRTPRTHHNTTHPLTVRLLHVARARVAPRVRHVRVLRRGCAGEVPVRTLDRAPCVLYCS